MRRLIDLGDQSGRSQVREVTVLFLDLEGFTEFSRNRRATEISSYLNGIFSQAGPLVEQYGGTIDKYLGDGLMAFWGAPIEDEKHALRAVECALAIADTLSIHLRARKDVGSDGCRVRIGLHSGDVVVGDLGYEGRTDYTIVGDTVNQAKRTEESARGILPERLAVIAVTSRTVSLAGVTKESHFLRELSSKQSCILERAASR
ncbi:adenylate/guanylate cyclase domain-containing protein [Mesorhizobium sp. YR577]|uniref:adenylate/guanylate cyclase domain-containing protein n=1 Tax=Mesorhizobium sp. YR577 TaxID=1884373 RepID=UPI001FCD48A2|nr:adenylate/guanylate cyclase domain-containing protein [Mesorhizobium sp. YR577]